MVDRIRILTSCIIVFACILLGQLYLVQMVRGDTLAAKADRQYVRSNQNLFDRGSIFFEDKEGRLIAGASVKSGFTLAIDPRKMEDLEASYEKISSVLPLDREMFLLRAGKYDDPYEEIAKQLPEDTAKKIEALNLPGVSV